MRRRIRREARTGFSLLEMTVSLSASAVLLAGMSGTLFLALQANRTDLGGDRYSRACDDGLAEIARDATHMTALRSVSPSRSIEFEVQDRTKDDVNDFIRYAWAGTPGDPLTRSFNGNAPTVVIDQLQSFSMTPTWSSRTAQELAPVMLTSGVMCWWNLSTANDEVTTSLSAGQGIGTDYQPGLPEGATSWTISRVELKCGRSGPADGVSKLRIWSANADRKPAIMLSEQVVNESTLTPTAVWTSFPISPPVTLLPSQRSCVTVQHSSGAGSTMQIRYENFPSLWSLGSTWKLTTSNGGSSWAQQWDDKLLIRLYGSYEFPGVGVVDVIKTELAELKLEAQAGPAAVPVSRASVRVRNRPAAVQ